jgi:hypothetical protein
MGNNMAAKKLIRKITCSRKYSCFVSIENVDNKPVLKFDFRIKSYQVCNYGWKEYQFPENIVINDKLYLDEELKNHLLKILSGFADTGYLENDEQQLTSRGFSYNELMDLKNRVISVQQSSANGSFIWFGCSSKIHKDAYVKEGDNLVKYEYPRGDVLVNERLHLSIPNTRKLIKAINELWKLNEVNILEKELAVNSPNKKPNKI